jgi:GNAT superfamily N-acetyltransferase
LILDVCLRFALGCGVALMQIGYLADHPEFIPTLARWHHQEWAYLRPGDSLEARTARLRKCCGHCEIPTVVIAFTVGTLLGSAMLIAHDMDTRMELSPWLAGVFVAPGRRCRGIGASLVQRVIHDATVLGVERLYLYTPNADQFYSRRGWLLVEHTRYRKTDVVVMSYDCATVASR